MAEPLLLATLEGSPTFLVLGDATLPVGFGRAARDASGTLIVGIGPEEWLLLGGRGEPARPGGSFVSVVDVTHARTWLRLHGSRAPDLLAKLCAVDLGDLVTPDGAAFRSSVAKVVTDVVRDDDGVRSYLLGCDRSLGEYLHDALRDAGTEFGLQG